MLTTIAGLFVALAVLASPVEAQAQSAGVQVQVILASNSGGGMDGSLGSMSSQLRSRFGQYNSFQRLSASNLSLRSGSSRSVGLPNGSSMTVTFQGMSGSSYRISVSLPGGGTTVTSPPGGVFFVAGPAYNGGVLLIAFRT